MFEATLLGIVSSSPWRLRNKALGRKDKKEKIPESRRRVGLQSEHSQSWELT